MFEPVVLEVVWFTDCLRQQCHAVSESVRLQTLIWTLVKGFYQGIHIPYFRCTSFDVKTESILTVWGSKIHSQSHCKVSWCFWATMSHGFTCIRIVFDCCNTLYMYSCSNLLRFRKSRTSFFSFVFYIRIGVLGIFDCLRQQNSVQVC